MLHIEPGEGAVILWTVIGTLVTGACVFLFLLLAIGGAL